MSLQKKCLTASAITHGLLVLLVLVGSAFIPHKPPKIEGPEFELFTLPDEVTAEPNQFGGGNPNVTERPAPAPQPVPVPASKTLTPPAAIPEPQPKPAEPVPEVRREPPPEPQRIEKPEPRAEEPNPFDLSKVKTIKKPADTASARPNNPAFDLSSAKKRKITTQDNNSREATATAKDTRETDRSAQFASTLANSANRLKNSLSTGGTSLELPGPGGASRVSYEIYLTQEYRRAWVPPAKSERAPVRVRVVIARDGTVLSAEIVTPSSSRDANAAAAATLRRIKKFQKSPPTDEPQVTYTFTFAPED
jgi:TonB family protein